MISKKIITPHRIRRIDGGFSFIPHRFLTDGFLASLNQKELLLYLFLIVVSDRHGLSFYSYDTICSLLQFTLDHYIEARDGLIEKDLIAFDGTIFQVLSLPSHPVQGSAQKEDSAAIVRLIRQSLQEAEDEFNRFTRDNQLISIDMQSENLLARAREIQNKIRGLHEDRRELEDILLRLNQFIENPPGSADNFYSTKVNSRYEITEDNLVELLLKRDTLLKAYTARHPQVVAISNEIIENARKMAILLHLHISDMEDIETHLKERLKVVSSRADALVDERLEVNRLKRRVESFTNMTAHSFYMLHLVL